jgi:hypothetical protein
MQNNECTYKFLMENFCTLFALNSRNNNLAIMQRSLLLLLINLFFIPYLYSQDYLVEAESFENKGGWVVDPQFVEEMGSPYLLAHGLGEAVGNASTTVTLPEKGTYNIWVRTKNWAPGNWKAPGRFMVLVDGKALETELGTVSGWTWQKAGTVNLKKTTARIELKDLTGFDGRCDALWFSKNDTPPPSGGKTLKDLRNNFLYHSLEPADIRSYDLVIVGGGIAGTAAAIASAEEGLNVALIHDRPVLGGNASSEIRVHTLGIYGYFERILKLIDTEHYPNGSPEALKDEQKRMENVAKYKNIHLFLNYRAYNAHTTGNRITSVDASETSTGERIRFTAPLFADCTGDGWVGFWAGADYMYGRESSVTFDEAWDKYGELWSPAAHDNRVMGSSVLWRSYDAGKASPFPEIPWATAVAGDYAAANGEWQWEYSDNDLNQASNAEAIRDHMLRAIYGSFYNEKQKPGNENLKLEWVSSLVGKRESRRLKGDYVFTFRDVLEKRNFSDAVVMEDREIDVHYQDCLLDPEKPDFLSTALYYDADRYYVPYRCLYSVNVSNLFMAGRCFSCSHVGLGGPRVMRTTGQMGAAVGFAAWICHEHNVLPRQVYMEYLDEYMKIVKGQAQVGE